MSSIIALMCTHFKSTNFIDPLGQRLNGVNTKQLKIFEYNVSVFLLSLVA